MIRTTVYLTDDLHQGLKRLAVEKRCSMADLLREAVAATYREDLRDLRTARKAWKSHLKHPERAIPAREYFGDRSRNA